MSEKQAVLLIHGIGEQHPMDTLRGFVESVWTKNTAIHKDHSQGAAMWSKPDNISGSYELRCLTTAANTGGIRTDFFECYWAHLMHGNKMEHVLAWGYHLLWRRPSRVPRQLILLYRVLWLTIFIVAVLFAISAYDIWGLPSFFQGLAPLFVGAGSLLLALANLVLINIVGDAARYLSPSPDNIHRRAEIRRNGVELIRKLHAEGYSRIVIVGHSLGAVIGYDILTHSWVDYHRDFSPSDNTSVARQALESLMQNDESEEWDVDGFQTAQKMYLNELKLAGNKWRVTDFITLGSPLAHAAVLLAKDADDLNDKISDRELPTCPPKPESSGGFTFKLKFDEGTAISAYAVPHHAAMFAPTRWSNLYFPSRGIFLGDVIGGPTSQILGCGIRDIPVQTKRWNGLVSHTSYWYDDPRNSDDDNPITHLRAVLDLADENEG
ncbi:MAG: hypothetical protein DRR06_08870 [Gammaproteobacteria bacterium]|nr:MAG: hypothetical protein DRR06_08870 [Gammaproteobacteria bacterium]